MKEGLRELKHKIQTF